MGTAACPCFFGMRKGLEIGACWGFLPAVLETTVLLKVNHPHFGQARGLIWFYVVPALSYMVAYGAVGSAAGVLLSLRRSKTEHANRLSAQLTAFMLTLSVLHLGAVVVRHMIGGSRRIAVMSICVLAALVLLCQLWSLARSRRVFLSYVLLERGCTRYGLPGAAVALVTMLVAAFLLAPPRRATSAATPARPNLLLVTIDTLRADRLGCYGYAPARTPHIDRTAREGARFQSAYCPIVLTGPSHASLLTSSAPARHRVTRNGECLPATMVTLAEILQDQGLQTFAAVSVEHLNGHISGFDRGFDDFRNRSRLDLYTGHSLCHFVDMLLGKLNKKTIRGLERCAEETTDQLLDWLSRHSHSRFFAWVHFFDPHFPYLDGMAPDEEAVRALREHLVGEPHVDLTDAGFAMLNRLYDVEVSTADQQWGRIVDYLADLQLTDRTVIVITADHGETHVNPRVERRYWYAHADVYEETARVPLIISFPGLVAGGTTLPDPVSLLDVGPTCLALLGVPPAEGFDGYNLADLLSGEQGSLQPRTIPIHHNTQTSLESHAINEQHWKLIMRGGGAPLELYNLAVDPLEAHNLATQHPDITDRLAAALNASRESFVDADRVQEIPADVVTRLRSLGYVE